MCGRFTITNIPPDLAAIFDLDGMVHIEPHWNIAPSMMAPAVCAGRPAGGGVGVLTPERIEKLPDPPPRALTQLRWGLVPSWAKDPAIGGKLINARSETAAEKPSFRTAFKRRRCLILADGFYEWKKQGRAKQPYYIRMTDRRLFAFAGLWEHWDGADGSLLQTCTVLTCEPNELVGGIHDRMPCILRPEDYAAWINPHTPTSVSLRGMLRPWPAGEMTLHAVGRRVNSPAHDDPTLIESTELF